jgi:AraC family transcriptional activator of pobA
MMSHHLGSLLLHLWRASGSDSTVKSTSITTVQRFSQYIELHYRDNLSIEVFAKLLGVTRAHLHDACHRSAHRTPLKLVLDRRLEEARLRLANTEFPVEQIAYRLGFSRSRLFQSLLQTTDRHRAGRLSTDRRHGALTG